MATMSVEYNVRTGKFALIGKEALGYASDAKALVLSQREIMQVVDLYNKGVFSEIKSENLTVKKVRVSKAESKVEKFFQTTSSSSSDEEEDETSSCEKITVPELKKQAKALGIKGYSKMKKSVLIAAIDAAQEDDEDE